MVDTASSLLVLHTATGTPVEVRKKEDGGEGCESAQRVHPTIQQASVCVCVGGGGGSRELGPGGGGRGARGDECDAVTMV